MFGRYIKDAATLEEFLQANIQDYQKQLNEFQAALTEGTSTLSGKLGWIGITLQVAVHRAAIAEGLLAERQRLNQSYQTNPKLKDYLDNKGWSVGEAWFYQALHDAWRHAVDREMRLGSRSTSAAANLLEDAQRAFWLDLLSKAAKPALPKLIELITE